GGVGRYADPERQVIVCHYPDRDEIWASMTETSMAQAQASPSGNDELAFERDFHYPERFVRIATRPPAPRAARADWRKIRRQIENRLLEFGGMAALFERSGSGEAPDWLITLPPLEDGCWLSRGNADSLPTLPPTPALRIVHELLHGLMTLRSRFNNAIHIKNEGNLYLWATPEESARLSELADTINQGIERLQCQAGSETRWRWPFDEGAAPGLTPLADHPGSPEKPVGIGSLLLALLLLCLTLTAVWHFPKTALFSILPLAAYRLIRRG
ncbi:MAG: hypothetical protein LBV49_13070, partial [Azonexus sp.]|nr:hypothetical protein [Azonexus sp.]